MIVGKTRKALIQNEKLQKENDVLRKFLLLSSIYTEVSKAQDESIMLQKKANKLYKTAVEKMEEQNENREKLEILFKELEGELDNYDIKAEWLLKV